MTDDISLLIDELKRECGDMAAFLASLLSVIDEETIVGAISILDDETVTILLGALDARFQGEIPW